MTELKVVLHSIMCGFILNQESAFEVISELVAHCSSYKTSSDVAQVRNKL